MSTAADRPCFRQVRYAVLGEGRVGPPVRHGNRVWPAWIDQTNPGTLVPIVSAADDIVVLVAGGGGRHSAWMSGWVTRVCTEEVVRPG